jgi:hypothetical protein
MSGERSESSGSVMTQAVSADVYREEMWETISRSWSDQASRHARTRSARLWGSAGLGLAAMLAIGVFLGRWSVGVDGQHTATIIDDSVIERPLSTPYRIAVAEHFREAETLLVLFESSERADPGLSELARRLAATSRMLMASDAGRDAEIRSILLELELLLAQISRLVDDDPTELDIVRTGVEEADALVF